MTSPTPFPPLAPTLDPREAFHATRGGCWRGGWGGSWLVSLFQRPESRARAMAKARAELRPGAWLVSLELVVAGEAPTGRLEGVQGRPVWLYQMH